MVKLAAPWLAVGAILGLMLAYVAWLRPADRFGAYHDDTLYFSLAQALAEGRGSVMPSVPGTPRQSKYPILYPWLLSWVWRWNLAFPDNIGGAVWLTAAFACGYVAAVFRLLRGLGGAGEWTALAITALCAFHPVVGHLAGAVLSDMPFAALALWAVVAAGAGLRAGGSWPVVVAAGALAGLATATRTLGVAVVAGLVAFAVGRRLWRQAAAVAAAAAPFVWVAVAWSAVSASPEGPPGWRQTWLYYTNYGEFWKLCVPNFQVLSAMVTANIGYWLSALPSYCLFPALGQGESLAGNMLDITLAVGMLAGMVRHARRHGCKPLHAVLGIYSAAIWFWNYTLMDRFLLPFLPLFYLGLWVETQQVMGLLRQTRRGSERAMAGVLAVGLVAVGVLAARYYLVGSPLRRPPARRELRLEKQQAYQWIRANTPPATRLIAYDDAALYLHTGRQALRPIAFSTEAFFRKDEQVLARDLARLTDTPRAIGARYWLSAEDDFRLETAIPLIQKGVAELKAGWPVVFRSSGGRVQVHRIVLNPAGE